MFRLPNNWVSKLFVLLNVRNTRDRSVNHRHLRIYICYSSQPGQRNPVWQIVYKLENRWVVALLLAGITDVFSKASKPFYDYFHLFIQKYAYVRLYERYFYLHAASRFGRFCNGKVSSDNGKVIFEQARKSYRRSGGTAPPTDLDTTWKSAASLTPWPF